MRILLVGYNELNEWYVLRAKFNRALVAQRMLSQLCIESFVPMQSRVVVHKGRRVRQKVVPVLMNLIFVKTTFSRVRQLQVDNGYLYYLTHQEDGAKRPMVVPREQMESFISFVEGNADKVEYVDVEALSLKAGEKIRITSGPFEGKEATFVKVRGKRSRQVVVAIDGLIAVLLPSVEGGMIERI